MMKTACLISLLFGFVISTSIAQANLFGIPRKDSHPDKERLSFLRLLETEPDEIGFGDLESGPVFPPGLWLGEQFDWLMADSDCDLAHFINGLLLDRDPLFDIEDLPLVDLVGILEAVDTVLKDSRQPGSQCPPVPTGSAIPEPSTYGICGAIGILGLILVRRFRIAHGI